MTRKIIQIAAVPNTGSNGSTSFITLLALCDDGTTWRRSASDPDLPWKQLPEIPQPKETLE